MASALDYAQSLSRYQPQTQGAIRRSQYLQDALDSIGESAKRDPQSLGEALARVGQAALLKRGQDRSTAELAKALSGERDTAEAPTMAWLKSFEPAATGFAQQAPAPQAAAQPPAPSPAPPVAPVQQQPLPTAQRAAPDWSDPKGVLVAALGGTPVNITSQRRTPEHNRAVGGARNSHHLDGTAVDFVPNGMSTSEAAAALKAQGLPLRELKDEGDHVHVAWNPNAPQPGPQMAAAPGPPPGPQMAAPQGPAPGPQMAAPPGPPPGPQQQQQAPPARQPTQQEMAIVQDLLANPQTHAQGIAYAQKLRQEYAAPLKNEITNINGVPHMVDPYSGRLTPLQVPDAARSRIATPEQLGIQAPPGTTFSQSPVGDVRQISAPQAGQQVAPGPGGAYREVPIQGGANDPMSPGNRLEAMQTFRGELKPIIDAATSLRRNIDAVRSGYRQQNGSGDIAITNGIQKLIDEGVVREGDVALQLKAQGIEGGVAGLMGMLRSDGLYSPQIRDRVLRTAEDLYKSLNGTYRSRAEGYRGIVEGDYGPGSFSRVLPPETAQALGWTDGPDMPAPQPSAMTPPAPGAKRGQDGGWYIEDPTKKGSFPRIQQDERGFYIRGSDGQKLHWVN